jgi:hypothetical protein
LQQQAAAITGFLVSGDSTTVSHAGEGPDCRFQQVVTGLALHMGDKAKTATVPEFARVDQAGTYQSGILCLAVLPDSGTLENQTNKPLVLPDCNYSLMDEQKAFNNFFA